MNKIKVMSEALANQIAAGEVVERPSSVVKELVENAIDANSKSIIIEIIESGIHEIKVTDDGDGIYKDDLSLVFAPHATSKIYTKEDLFKISSLGFRGEALASIASISDIKIESKGIEESIGHYIHYKGSKLIDTGIAQSKQGTKITVNNLFYNTPARLKHLKTLNTELKHIVSYVQNSALAFPNIKFSLYSDSQLVFQSLGNGDLQQAIASVYQPRIARDLIEINGENFEFKIQGYLSKPTLTRTTQNYIHWIVNGRSVKSRILSEVLIRAYGRRLMVGRFPIAVIHIDLDPRLVDVNVHPTKQIVRLSKEDELSALLKSLIESKLMELNAIPIVEDEIPIISSKNKENLSTNSVNTQLNFEYQYPQNNNKTEVYTRLNNPEKILKNQKTLEDENNFISEESQSLNSFQSIETRDSKYDLSINNMPNFHSLRYIGQIHGTYLIAENLDGFYLIDQHAAQEKIRYEKFMNEEINVTVQQQLLMPEIITLSKENMLKVELLKNKLNKLGIFLTQFGPSSYQLESYPHWLSKEDLSISVIDILDFIEHNPDANVNQIIEKSLISKSCKGAIKANHHLEDHEAIYLIQSLGSLKDPYHCPHGRPILIQVTNKMLEKWFKRVQDNHTSQFNVQFND